MLTLYIKGTEDETRTALMVRGFVDYVYRGESKYGDQVWKISHDWQHGMVIKWFAEDAKLIPGKGYAPGTLLFFSVRETESQCDGYH